MTFTDADVGEVQPSTQMGRPQCWCLIKFTHLLPQPEPSCYFSASFMSPPSFPNGTPSVTQHSQYWQSLHDAHGGRGTKLHPLLPLRHSSPCSPVAVEGWGELGSHQTAPGWGQPKTCVVTPATNHATAVLHDKQVLSSSTCSPQPPAQWAELNSPSNGNVLHLHNGPASEVMRELELLFNFVENLSRGDPAIMRNMKQKSIS